MQKTVIRYSKFQILEFVILGFLQILDFLPKILIIYGVFRPNLICYSFGEEEPFFLEENLKMSLRNTTVIQFLVFGRNQVVAAPILWANFLHLHRISSGPLETSKTNT